MSMNRADLKCNIHPLNTLMTYKYVVVCSNYQGKWVLSKHKERDTWETQGGHIEPNETPLEAAKRELYEESGICDATIYPVCDYFGYNETRSSNGMVFLAAIHSLGTLPESEMEAVQLFDVLPNNMTYPDVTPILIAEAEKFMREDVYITCPTFENDKYLLRLVSKDDCLDLLKVYSDKRAVPLFNSDNCNGDDFYYTTEERMQQAIDFWIYSYDNRWFVRWSIVDKEKDEAVGTIELFHRDADAHFPECGLLRLDLRSDYEKANEIENILSLIIPPTYDLFYCNTIATKAIAEADERRVALKSMNFSLADEKIVGNDGTVYGDYFVLGK